MPSDVLNIFLKKKFLLSIFLHILHGFIFEKSKLYYPYTFGRNILLIKTDLFKFYLSICFVFLGIPCILSKFFPKNYFSARLSVLNRYQNRNSIDMQIGSYLLGISMLLTGFCPSYLPMYLALSPVLFLYSLAASYTGYIFYHVFGRIFSNRVNTIDNVTNNSPGVSNEKRNFNGIIRIMIVTICIVIVLVLETGEQSISSGHSTHELIDLLHSGDFLPPGLTGTLCGTINLCLIFICEEYRSLTSEWLLNIFHYTSDISVDKKTITAELCIEQILKILAMAFGVRLSLYTSRRHEVPTIDWLFYTLVGCGSFIGSLSVCLTTATFTDHVYLLTGFVESVSPDMIICALGSSWFLIYLSKILGLSNLS